MWLLTLSIWENMNTNAQCISENREQIRVGWSQVAIIKLNMAVINTCYEKGAIEIDEVLPMRKIRILPTHDSRYSDLFCISDSWQFQGGAWLCIYNAFFNKKKAFGILPQISEIFVYTFLLSHSKSQKSLSSSSWLARKSTNLRGFL